MINKYSLFLSADTIYLYNRSTEIVNVFIENLKKFADKDIELIPISNMKELVSNFEIIITATTSLTAVIPNEEIYDGKLIVGVGSYKENMRELSENLFRSVYLLLSKLVVYYGQLLQGF